MNAKHQPVNCEDSDDLSALTARERKYEVLVSAEFREFYRSMKDGQMKRSIDGLVDALQQTPLDAGDFVRRQRSYIRTFVHLREC